MILEVIDHLQITRFKRTVAKAVDPQAWNEYQNNCIFDVASGVFMVLCKK